MLSFDLTEELAHVQKAVREFAQKEVRPRLREVEQRRLPQALIDRFAELGLFGIDWPEAAGGMNLGLLARAIVEEELAQGDLGTAFALDRGGAASQLLKVAGAFGALSELAGSGTAALAMAEEGKAQHDFRTVARRSGDGWVLSGRKAYVMRGGEASMHVVLAQVEPGAGLAGAGAFLVRGGQGLSAGRAYEVLGLQAVPMREVVLENVSLPEGARLDRPGKLPELLRRFYDELSVVTAARAVGVAAAAYEYARAYAEQRVAFGKPIGHFQAVAFTLADMATAVDGARWMVWKAAWALDRGPATAEAAAAQAQAMEAAWFCTNFAVQVLGGAGYVQDHPVEKWMREAKVLSLYGLHAQAAHATLAASELGQSLTEPDLFPLPSLHPSLS